MDKNTEIIFNLLLIKFQDDYFEYLRLYPSSEHFYNQAIQFKFFKMLKDCFPKNEKFADGIEQDVNQMLISIKDFDKAGMEEAMASIIIASVNQHGLNSVLSNLESRADTPLIRWVINMLRELKY